MEDFEQHPPFPQKLTFILKFYLTDLLYIMIHSISTKGKHIYVHV